MESECAVMAGLIEEHDDFKEEDPSPDLLDIFNVAAGIKIERYEISAYESLIRMARLMRHKRAEKLLAQNLKKAEQQTLKKLEELGKKLKPENMGLEQEEEVPATQRRRGRRAP